MDALASLRPTVIPALLYLAVWPVFRLLPARFARPFFTISSLAFISLVDGTWVAGGLLVAALFGYWGIEHVARLRRGRGAAFAVLLIVAHAAYWACFWLPPPEAYRTFVPRPIDQTPVFILFSGIGLTFFRLMSFAWDRYNGRVGPTSVGRYLAYLFFFPQFRHGPIERFGGFDAQMPGVEGAHPSRAAPDSALPASRAASRRPTTRDLWLGVRRILLTYAALAGVAVVIAVIAGLTGFADRRHDLPAFLTHPESLSLLEIALLVHLPPLILYVIESASASLQLAVSRAFGVCGTENFRRPLLATNPAEFWRRWQSTLSAWIHDYAYMPLAIRTRHARMAVVLAFVYCGLLHAPQVRCVVWGLFNGLSMVAYNWFEHRRPRRSIHARQRWSDVVGRWLARLATFLWLGLGGLILLDPDSFGLRLLGAYARAVLAAIGVLH